MATSTIALERPVSSTPAPGRGTLGRLARQRGAIVGLMVLGTLVVLAVGAPLLNSRDPIKTSVRDALQPPGPRFVLGSDQFGRDVASRVLHGTRISLTVGLIAVSIAALRRAHRPGGRLLRRLARRHRDARHRRAPGLSRHSPR